MTQLAEEKGVHLSNFEQFEREANALPWLDDLRKAGMAQFDAAGFPGGDDENWRFTNIAPIVKTKFTLAPAEVNDAAARRAEEYGFGNEAVSELVFVNGHFNPKLSRLGKLPRGVIAKSLLEAFTTDGDRIREHIGRYADFQNNPFVALNAGFVRDGAYILLPRGSAVEKPIHLLFVNTGGSQPTISHPRVLILAE